MAFVKLDSRTLDSSLWSCDPDRIVFLTMLMMAEPYGMEAEANQIGADSLEPTGFVVPPGAYGIVRTSSDGILRRALISDDVGVAALWRLSQPDSRSRSTRFDGRRIARVDGGWVVLNYAQFREIDTTGPERMRKYRSRLAEAKRAPAPPNDDAVTAGQLQEWAAEEAEELAARGNCEPPPPPLNIASAFRELWADFIATKVPRPIGKKQSERHFRASIKTQADVEALGRALIAYRASERVLGGFVQQGSTWLNNWRDWVDYVDAAKVTSEWRPDDGMRR